MVMEMRMTTSSPDSSTTNFPPEKSFWEKMGPWGRGLALGISTLILSAAIVILLVNYRRRRRAKKERLREEGQDYNVASEE